jgi:vancomycin permeability regulator SanA
MNRAAGVFDIHDAVICTQDAYTARSVYLAEQAGIDAVAVSIPSKLGQSARSVQQEALKTMLAFVESLFRAGPPARATAGTKHAAFAER